MKNFTKFLALAIFLTISSSAWGQSYVSFHGRHGCVGDQFGAELSYSCQNLPRSVARLWSQLSVDTNGACITLYDDYDCEGREVANFNRARCRNIYAISNIKSFRQCSGRTNSAVISG